MGFIEDNRNFINIKLYVGMKHLSESEKNNRYLSLRIQVLERLKNSYSSTSNKLQFYKEAFEILNDYEFDYLWLNVFFEEDCVQIINYLIKTDVLKSSNQKGPLSVASHFANYIICKMQRNEAFNYECEIDFIKTKFIEIVDNIGDQDWKSESKNVNPIITNYSSWLVSNLETEITISKLIDSFILFIKIWNYFPVFQIPFNNTKAILFYNYINTYLENIVNNDKTLTYFKFISQINDIITKLFVNLKYIPLVDNSNNNDYKSGYIVKRDDYFKHLESINYLNSITDNYSYIDLINLVNNNNEEFLFHRSRVTVIKKISNLETLNNSDLQEIRNLELSQNSKNLRDFLYQKLYIF